MTRKDPETYLEEAAELARASSDRRTLCETRLYQAIVHRRRHVGRSDGCTRGC